MKSLQILEVSEASHQCGAYGGDCSCPEIGNAIAVNCQTMAIYESAFYADALSCKDVGKVIPLVEDSIWQTT